VCSPKLGHRNEVEEVGIAGEEPGSHACSSSSAAFGYPGFVLSTIRKRAR
jgi:hypothetical protein